MKMDGDLVNGEATTAPPTPVDIGREFVRQYYTMLSEHPEDAFKFYSHESVFVHNDVNVTGQQKIQKAIEDIGFTDSKVRVFSIKGCPTIASGIVLQVAGEMTLRGSLTRRFVQTFVLGQQRAKKFYVHNDVFTFHDKVFETSETSSPTPTPQVSTPKVNGVAPPSKPILNGHSHSEPKVAPVPAPKEQTPIKEEPVPLVTKKREETPKKVEEPVQPEPVVVAPPPTPVVVDNTPKTWATMVGGRSAAPKPAAPAPVPQSAPSAVAPKPSQTSTNAAPRDNRPHVNGTGDQGMRRIYLGNIVRNVLPEHTNVVEQEIRQFFSGYGEVESIAVPRRVLDNPQDAGRTAFAFITMKSSSDAAKVFADAREERGIHFLRVKVDAFGFDGEATISEQKTDRGPPGAPSGFRGGRGGNFGGRGGSGFIPRGGRGGNTRGGFRGGHAPNNQQQH